MTGGSELNTGETSVVELVELIGAAGVTLLVEPIGAAGVTVLVTWTVPVEVELTMTVMTEEQLLEVLVETGTTLALSVLVLETVTVEVFSVAEGTDDEAEDSVAELSAVKDSETVTVLVPV
jgi:hypothetical protein